MAIQRISSGSTFEEQIGYSRAVVAGPWVLVSGTTGYDYASMNISDDLVEQTGQCLRNIEEALRHAGCSLDQVVRVHYIVAPGQDFSLCWPLLKKAFDQARPTATMWHAELANSQMKIEIEVTAYLGAGV